jgi:hypothetical protein
VSVPLPILDTKEENVVGTKQSLGVRTGHHEDL